MSRHGQHTVQTIEEKNNVQIDHHYISDIWLIGLWLIVSVIIVFDIYKIFKKERRFTLFYIWLGGWHIAVTMAIFHHEHIAKQEYIVIIGMYFLFGILVSIFGTKKEGKKPDGPSVIRGGSLVSGEDMNTMLWTKKVFEKLKKIKN